MNRLSVRLTLAIVATTLLAVGLVAVIANRTAGSEFRRYLAAGQMAGREELAAQLSGVYAQNGSWDGIAGALEGVSVVPGRNMNGRGQGGMGRGMGGMAAMQVADAAGQVVYDSQGASVGKQLTRSQREAAVPIVVGQDRVGYLLVLPPGQMQLAGAERVFLDRINAALVASAAVALLVGVLLGVLLARTLAAPLGRVAVAAEAIAAGDLSQRVPEQGTEETRAVARSFNQMAANLEQAEQLRRNLMADVAHELRTPLTVIQGNLQALLDGVYPLERGEIATIYDETRLLSRLVADLRDLAQAEAGQLKLTMQPVDLSALLAQTAASFAPVAEAQGTTLVVAAPAAPASTAASPGDAPSALWVMADPDRLAQVLRNLLSNALRHTPQGGQVHVDVQNDLRGLPRPRRSVCISIQDTGTGIPPADLPHVFDRFWSRAQYTSERTVADSGSGLGLAITKYLVEAQGGEIGVESRVGEGTRFWFTLMLPELS
jgi:signal transduction histidine kinase